MSNRRKLFKTFCLLLVTAFLIAGLPVPVKEVYAEESKPQTIKNGEIWYDDRGEPIQGHGGNILYHEGKFYWVGENKYTANFSGIALYSSEDLVNWKFENMILTPDTPTGDGGTIGFCTIERPKLIYNGKEFVLWAHWENGRDYTESKLIVAKCDTINGDYEFVKLFNPQVSYIDPDTGERKYKTNRSLDMTIFTDVITNPDGTTTRQSYLISANGWDMALYKLTEDCLDIIPEESYDFWLGAGREAPALVKIEDYYVLLTSGQSGWMPNQTKYGYTKDITDKDGWTPATELRTLGNNSTYYSQPTNVAIIEDTQGNKQYLYMGDRWNRNQLRYSTYVWLPLNVEIDRDSDWEVNLSMDYYPEWYLDVSTGTIVAEKPMLVSEGKPLTSTIPGTAEHPISQANDGIVDTDDTWGNSNYYGLSEQKLPFSMTLDLEDVYDLNRVDLVTRLCNGSETYYQYTVQGSLDGDTWDLLLDELDNMMVGFRSNPISGKYRYLRLNVYGIYDHKNDNPAVWAAGIVEWQVFANEKVSSKEVLEYLYGRYKDLELGYYTEESYNALMAALEAGAELLDNPDATESDFELAVDAINEALANLTLRDDAPIEVNKLEGTATIVNTLPELPEKVSVKTKGGDTVDVPVKWPTLTEDMFSKVYDCVKVTGIIPDTDLEVTINVEVIPNNLIYFIDSGTNSTGTSPAHRAVLNSGLAPKLMNTDYSDPRSFGVGDIWRRSSGHVTINSNAEDKFESITGGNTKPISYFVTLDPGVYIVTLAAEEATNVQSHHAKGVVMTAKGATFEDGELVAYPREMNSGKLIVEERTMVQLDMVGVEGKTAAVTFIGIAEYHPTVEEVMLSIDKDTIERTKTAQLSVTAKWDNGETVEVDVDKVEFVSLNEDIATVDKNGVVIGRKVGSTEIMAIVEIDGNRYETNSVQITVKELKMKEAEGFEISYDPIIVEVGEESVVTITAKQVADLAGFTLRLSYDGELLGLKDVAVNQAFETLEHQEDGNKVTIVAAMLGEEAGLNGDVELAKLTFTAKDKDALAAVTILGGSELSDTAGGLYTSQEDVLENIVIANSDVTGGGTAINDLVLVARTFGATKDSEMYDARLDMNKDGVIDIIDIAYVAARILKV